MLTMGAGTVVQFAVPALGPLIVQDLGLARAEFGAIMATYYVAAAVISPHAGRLADRIATRTGILACFGLGSSGLLLVSRSSSTWLMMLAVLLGGAGAALVNPATNRVIMRDVPQRARGLVTGLKQSGVQLATIASGLLLPSLALLLGWRCALVALAILVGSLSVTTLAVVEPQGPAPAVSAEATRAPSAGANASSGAPTETTPTTHPMSSLTALCVFAGLMGAGMAAISTYLPVYIVEAAGSDIRTAGLLMVTIGVSAVIARLVWGHFADRGVLPSRILTGLGLAAACAGTLLTIDPVRFPWTVWLAVILLGASGSGWHGVAMVSAMTIAGHGRAGWATGRVIAAFYAGLALSPVPIGLLADTTGSFIASWVAASSCFGIAAMVIGRRGQTDRRASPSAPSVEAGVEAGEDT
jgi:predicted MFS family arabinose efflux permease